MHPAPLPTLTCPCTPRSTSWLSCCGHSFSFSSWWQCVTRTPRWSTMSVSLADSPPTPPGNEGCPWGKGDPFLLLPRGTAQCRLDARGHSQPLFPRPLCQQAIAVGRHPALAAGPPVHREQHLLSAADARRAARPPGQLPGFPVSHEGQAWVRPGQCVCGGGWVWPRSALPEPSLYLLLCPQGLPAAGRCPGGVGGPQCPPDAGCPGEAGSAAQGRWPDR